jgi:hypothetical protein
VERAPVRREKIQLLFGPYRPPPLQRGQRAFCQYRDRLVVVTGWSDAPIPWPLCRSLDPRGGGIGPLVEDELARAVRHESAAAIRHWWGVGGCAVGRWRKELGVRRMDTGGSRRLILAAVQAGVVARGDAPPTLADDQGILWTAEDVALVGLVSDVEVARRTGRTLTAVRQKRKQLRLPNPEHPDSRYLPWTPQDDALVLTLPPAEVAALTGHSRGAVYARRHELRGAALDRTQV